MSEQQTPPKWAIDAAKEINSIVDEREFDDDLIIRVASVVVDATRSAVSSEREACAKRDQDALQEIYNEAAFVVTGAPWNLFAQWVVNKIEAIRARSETK